MALRDELAADAHESWMESQRANGFTTAISRQTGEEQMVPFDHLSDAVKAYDYALVDGFLAALEKRGYAVVNWEFTELVPHFTHEDYEDDVAAAPCSCNDHCDGVAGSASCVAGKP